MQGPLGSCANVILLRKKRCARRVEPELLRRYRLRSRDEATKFGLDGRSRARDLRRLRRQHGGGAGRWRRRGRCGRHERRAGDGRRRHDDRRRRHDVRCRDATRRRSEGRVPERAGLQRRPDDVRAGGLLLRLHGLRRLQLQRRVPHPARRQVRERPLAALHGHGRAMRARCKQLSRRQGSGLGRGQHVVWRSRGGGVLLRSRAVRGPDLRVLRTDRRVARPDLRERSLDVPAGLLAERRPLRLTRRGLH